MTWYMFEGFCCWLINYNDELNRQHSCSARLQCARDQLAAEQSGLDVHDDSRLKPEGYEILERNKAIAVRALPRPIYLDVFFRDR